MNIQSVTTTNPLAPSFELAFENFDQKEIDKWTSLGFDPELAKTDPEAVRFALSTKIAFTIAMFQRSAFILEGEPLGIRNVNGRAHFKVGGEWRPYSFFKNEIRYDTQFHRFEGWSFVHPDGFVRRDSVKYDAVYPIAQLTPKTYQSLLASAQKFWGPLQPEIDPGKEKSFVLQVVTTGRHKLPNAWWARNCREHFPEHASIRIVAPDGRITSFGLEMPLPDEAFLGCIKNYMGTGITNVPIPDYEETRRSDSRSVVSIPLTQERVENIFDFVRRANAGMSFNFARANCVKFVETVLGKAGVPMSTKISGAKLLSQLIPRISDIPVIGRPLSVVASVISTIFQLVVSPIVFAGKKILPTSVWKRINGVADIFLNGVSLYLLGAHKITTTAQKYIPHDIPEAETFTTAIRPNELFDPEAIPKHYSSVLKDWMKKQGSFQEFKNRPEDGFHCIVSEVQ